MGRPALYGPASQPQGHLTSGQHRRRVRRPTEPEDQGHRVVLPCVEVQRAFTFREPSVTLNRSHGDHVKHIDVTKT